nr:hypothetical protein [uncultured Oscillibacter sp.]
MEKRLDMKRLDCALNAAIASDITFLLGRTVSIFRDFKAHPGLYEKLGIPWYNDVLVIAKYTIIILFVTLAIKLVVRIKMKRQ